MSYPCSPNILGKRHRMGGIGMVEIAVDVYKLKKIAHPNPGKINFRRSCPEGSMPMARRLDIVG